MRHRSHRDDGRRPNAARWVRLVGGHDKFQTWQLAGTGYFVRHCGHPTANFPWYGERPDGSTITSGDRGECGMAFRYLDDAKVATELDHAGKRDLISLFASGRESTHRADRWAVIDVSQGGTMATVESLHPSMDAAMAHCRVLLGGVVARPAAAPWRVRSVDGTVAVGDSVKRGRLTWLPRIP